MKRFVGILSAASVMLPLSVAFAQEGTIAKSNTDLMSGSQSVATGYKAAGDVVGLKLGVNVEQPRVDPLLPVSTANPDPLKPVNPSSTGMAGAALDIKPDLGPLDSIELGTKAGSVADGTQVQGGLSSRLSIAGFGITGSQTYSMTQPDNPELGGANIPASRLQVIHGLGITVPGVDTRLNLSATQTPMGYGNDASKRRLSTSLQAVQPLVGPLTFSAGVTDNGTDAKPDANAKLGVTLGW